MLDIVPRFAAVFLFSDWLFLEEIGTLDSAFCNKKFRGVLLSLFSQINSSKFINRDPRQMNFITWMLRRSLEVGEIVLKERANNGTAPFVKWQMEVCPTQSYSCKISNVTVHCGPGFKCFKPLISMCSNLKSLTLISGPEQWESFEQSHISSFSPLLQNISALHFSGFKNISDASLANIAEHCKRLEAFSVCGSDLVTVVGVLKVLEASPHLVSLSLRDNALLNGINSLRAIAQQNAQLTHLTFTFDPTTLLHTRVVFGAALAVLSQFTKLQTLHCNALVFTDQLNFLPEIHTVVSEKCILQGNDSHRMNRTPSPTITCIKFIDCDRRLISPYVYTNFPNLTTISFNNSVAWRSVFITIAKYCKKLQTIELLHMNVPNTGEDYRDQVGVLNTKEKMALNATLGVASLRGNGALRVHELTYFLLTVFTAIQRIEFEVLE